MKRLHQILSLAIAFLLTAGMAACSSAETKPDGEKTEEKTGENAASAAKGAEETVGNFKLIVPDGWRAEKGSLIDKADENAFALFTSSDAMKQIRVSVNTEEIAAANVEMTRERNEDYLPHDVTLEAGGKTFRGVSYSYSSKDDCFQIYALFGEKAVVVQGSFCACNSELIQGILASLEYNG